MVVDLTEFDRGEKDGRKDGAAGVKPLAAGIMSRIYPASYRAGYEQGYAKASESRLRGPRQGETVS